MLNAPVKTKETQLKPHLLYNSSPNLSLMEIAVAYECINIY